MRTVIRRVLAGFALFVGLAVALGFCSAAVKPQTPVIPSKPAIVVATSPATVTYPPAPTTVRRAPATPAPSARPYVEATTEPAPTTEYYLPDYDQDDSDNSVHVDPPSRHTGHTGHPCRHGERDRDHDGYCGEG